MLEYFLIFATVKKEYTRTWPSELPWSLSHRWTTISLSMPCKLERPHNIHPTSRNIVRLRRHAQVLVDVLHLFGGLKMATYDQARAALLWISVSCSSGNYQLPTTRMLLATIVDGIKKRKPAEAWTFINIVNGCSPLWMEKVRIETKRWYIRQLIDVGSPWSLSVRSADRLHW